MKSAFYILSLLSGASAFSNCPIMYLEGAGVVTGYYTDSGVSWNNRPIYNDRFGNMIYSTGDFWHIGHTKVVDPCTSSFVKFRIRDSATTPVQLIGKAFASNCRTRYNHHLKLSCVNVDPGLDCDMATGLQCPNLGHDTALIVDFSYSVDGLEMVQQWCLMERLGKALAPNDPKQRVSLVAFAKTAGELAPLTTNGTSLTEAAGGYFKVNPTPTQHGTGINRHDRGGSTAIGEGLAFAYTSLQAGITTGITNNRKHNVVMMTDGTRNSGRAPLDPVLDLRSMGAVTQIIGVAPSASRRTTYLNEYKQYVNDQNEDLVSFVTDFDEYADIDEFRTAIGMTCNLHVDTCRDIRKYAAFHRSSHVTTFLGEHLRINYVGNMTLMDATTVTANGDQGAYIFLETRPVVSSSDNSVTRAVPYKVTLQTSSYDQVIFDALAPGTVRIGSTVHTAPGTTSFSSGTWTATSTTDCNGLTVISHVVTYGIAQTYVVTLEERTIVSSPNTAVYSVTVSYTPICPNTFKVGAGHTHTAEAWSLAMQGASTPYARGAFTRRHYVDAVTLDTTAGAPAVSGIGPFVAHGGLYNCALLSLSAASNAACINDVQLFAHSPLGPDQLQCIPLYGDQPAPGGGFPTDSSCSTKCDAPTFCSSGACTRECGDHGSDTLGQCVCHRSPWQGNWTRLGGNDAQCTHCWRDYHGSVDVTFEGYMGYRGTHCHEKCKGCLSQPSVGLVGAVREARSPAWGTPSAISTLETEFNEGTATRDFVSHTKVMTIKASAGCTGPVNVDITFLRANTFTHSVFGLYNWSHANERGFDPHWNKRMPLPEMCKPAFWDVHQDSQCLIERTSRVKNIQLWPGTEYGFFTLTNGWCTDGNGRLGETFQPQAAPAPLVFTSRAKLIQGDPIFTSDPDGNSDGFQHFAFLDGDALLDGNVAPAGKLLGNLIVGVEEHWALGDSDYNDNVYVIEGPNAGGDPNTQCGFVLAEEQVPLRPPTVIRATPVYNPPEKCIVPVAPQLARAHGFDYVTPYQYWGLIGTIFADGHCFAGNSLQINYITPAERSTSRVASAASDRETARKAVAVATGRKTLVSREVRITQPGALWFPSASPVKSLSDTNFNHLVHGAPKVAEEDEDVSSSTPDVPQLWVIFYYASWCDTARHVAMQIESAARLLPLGIKVGAVEQSRSPDTFKHYDISTTPTLKAIIPGTQQVFTYDAPRIDGGGIRNWAKTVVSAMGRRSGSNKIVFPDIEAEKPAPVVVGQQPPTKSPWAAVAPWVIAVAAISVAMVVIVKHFKAKRADGDELGAHSFDSANSVQDKAKLMAL